MSRRTRTERFIELRDLLLQRFARLPKTGAVVQKLNVGPFMVFFGPLQRREGLRFNMQIWPSGKQRSGHILHENKVANVDWDQQGQVTIINYRSGPWEEELLGLLRAENVVDFAPRKRDERAGL